METFKIPKAKEQVIPQAENLFKSVLLVGLLVGSLALAQVGVTKIDTYFSSNFEAIHLVIKWAFVTVLAVFNCILLTGIGVIAHEGIHGVLFKSRFWNDLWGGILSALVVFLPFYANREFHLTHHRYTHQPDLDPEQPLHNHSFWYAFAMGGFIALYQHYKIVAANLLGVFSLKWNKVFRGLKDICFVGVVVAFYFYLLPMMGISLWYTVVPTFVLVPMVYSFRAMCDHYAFAPAVSPAAKKSLDRVVNIEDQSEDLQGEQLQIDSWLILTNPMLTWLWSNINYQQVYHRYPYLSYRYLPEIFEATKHEQPYAVVNGYFRCLMHWKNMPYYSTHEQIKPFLFGVTSENSV
jgi:fatty acid desaturase